MEKSADIQKADSTKSCGLKICHRTLLMIGFWQQKRQPTNMQTLPLQIRWTEPFYLLRTVGAVRIKINSLPCQEFCITDFNVVAGWVREH